MESMKASTVLLYESRNTFLGACHVLSRKECVTKPSSAFQTIDLKGYICSICEALSDKVYKKYKCAQQ